MPSPRILLAGGLLAVGTLALKPLLRWSHRHRLASVNMVSGPPHDEAVAPTTDALAAHLQMFSLFVIDAAQLAREKGQLIDTKRAAETLLTDHRESEQALDALAVEHAIWMPKASDAGPFEQPLRDLRFASLQNFDHALAETLGRAYDDTLQRVREYIEAGATSPLDAHLQALAATLTGHRVLIEAMAALPDPIMDFSK